MGIWYATREQVQNSLEIAHTARSNVLVDSKLEAASRNVEGLLHRRFYPERRTISVDWPNQSYSPTWELLLGINEMISIETIVSGGTTLSSSDYDLRRGDDKAEPPYSRIEIDLSSSAAFGGGTTFQRSIVITGLFSGDKDTDTSVASGALNANISSSVTSVVINPSGGEFTVGVGSLLLVGTERMTVRNRSMSDSGQTLQGTMDASQADTLVAVTTGSSYAVGEIILIDSERMRIDDIAGNNLTVSRGWDGTTLAAHLVGAVIYALRTFTVSRGALGSTAAAHLANDAVYNHTYPGLINELCIAETVVMLEQNAAAYARVAGSGANARETAGLGLVDARANAVTAYGRKQRSTAI
jgi:hypothetical protein